MQAVRTMLPFAGAVRCSARQSLCKVPGSVLYKRGVATKKEDVVEYLKKAGILSDVLNDSFDPKVQLSVRFLSSGEEAAFGNTLTPVDAQGQPQVEVLPFPGDKGLPSEVTGKKGFIVMTDPDAPSKDDPKWSEYCHWVASTSLPSAKEGGEVVHNSKDLKDLIAYTKPAPPEGSGKHRYVLVLLQGEGDGSKSLPKSDGGEDRKNWSTGKPRQGLQQWAESNGLKAIGANYFFSEYKKEQTVDDINHDQRGLGVSGAGYGG